MASLPGMMVEICTVTFESKTKVINPELVEEMSSVVVFPYGKT